MNNQDNLFCPICKCETQVTWNWFKTEEDVWYHECWECNNVFSITEKVEEKQAIV